MALSLWVIWGPSDTSGEHAHARLLEAHRPAAWAGPTWHVLVVRLALQHGNDGPWYFGSAERACPRPASGSMAPALTPSKAVAPRRAGRGENLDLESPLDFSWHAANACAPMSCAGRRWRCGRAWPSPGPPLAGACGAACFSAAVGAAGATASRARPPARRFGRGARLWRLPKHQAAAPMRGAGSTVVRIQDIRVAMFVSPLWRQLSTPRTTRTCQPWFTEHPLPIAIRALTPHPSFPVVNWGGSPPQ